MAYAMTFYCILRIRVAPSSMQPLEQIIHPLHNFKVRCQHRCAGATYVPYSVQKFLSLEAAWPACCTVRCETFAPKAFTPLKVCGNPRLSKYKVPVHTYKYPDTECVVLRTNMHTIRPTPTLYKVNRYGISCSKGTCRQATIALKRSINFLGTKAAVFILGLGTSIQFGF